MKDPEFWHNKWASNRIGFHLEDVNPLLISHWDKLNPHREDKVFVPLCGKSEDLVWLATQHDEVQGVELSQIAVRAFFSEHFYTPMVTSISGQHELYQFDELSIYTGDFFTAPIEPVELVYDRAALIALPIEMRAEYAQRIDALLKPGGRILLVTLEYDQSEIAGPPFAVLENEIQTLFKKYTIERLATDVADEQHPKRAEKGLSHFAESVFLLQKPSV
ncbi:thiopurine S-methyltransferase [Vibrio agarivorans]|uniref:thiopurine S-methyltransferase n=1 Tax=Vibrio agarivorans TaxID=153622 RepID=UPI0025B50B48|nr:thiopurine S-methyltransferase [Vibrio agarivorans]MDN3663247.1 thiopurine S-methyltransferase [Vibrio agarivorans]